LAKEPPVFLSHLRSSKEGFLSWSVTSPYQRGPTPLRVLVPRYIRAGLTIYFLPVEPGMPGRWGDPLRIVQEQDLHNQLGFLAVFPSFSDWPWYANHPTDPHLQQEHFLVEGLVPFINRRFPDANNRILLGFSKAGVGAFSLILRHPDLFSGAGAWDAPLMKEDPDEFEMPHIYGSQDNFSQYRFSSLIRNQRALFRDRLPLTLGGFDLFRIHMEQAHQLLLQLEIPHHYKNETRRLHRWDSGWLDCMVRILVECTYS